MKETGIASAIVEKIALALRRGDAGVTPTVSYLVCGTNRTGTSLLGGLLKSTGVAGRPEECFWRGDEPYWAQRWEASGPAEYVQAAIREGTTPNGVFGVKVMWRQMPDVLAKLTAVHGDRWPSERALLEHAFPNLHFIWLWREEVVAQAVSFARAIQTNEWIADAQQRNGREPCFDFAQIQAFVGEIRKTNEAWQRWFAANEIRPFSLRYEDLVQDMEGVTCRLLAFLGVELPSGAIIQPQHSKLTDSVNEEWAARYRARAG